VRPNLRHLRVFLSLVETGSVTRTAELCRLSQPAVTQAIGKLERAAERPLFTRTRRGIFPTPAGKALAARAGRAFARLDPALGDLTPRLRVTATVAQLQALIATHEAENFTLAARRLGLAQPTVHRAVTALEQEAGKPLFERTAYGMVATRPAQALAQAARLAFAEFDQAESDLADLAGREVGKIVIGAMPLSRAFLLPRTIARFRIRRPKLPIRALDGPYEDLMAGLRRGEVDFLIGALRHPLPIGDVVQERLFDDSLVLVARPDHPALAADSPTLAGLARYPFIVATDGTPTRLAFDRLFHAARTEPASLIETGSMVLMRELLKLTDHIGCISRLQVEAELGYGTIRALPLALPETVREIGLTLRRGWVPTAAQRQFLDDLRAVLADT
jgi:DNA-binding transcriptional LysR family regulator